jgi:hypothetical protein
MRRPISGKEVIDNRFQWDCEKTEPHETHPWIFMEPTTADGRMFKGGVTARCSGKGKK